MQALGDGVYELTTLEGNVNSTVKRYRYRYDLTPKKAYHNMVRRAGGRTHGRQLPVQAAQRKLVRLRLLPDVGIKPRAFGARAREARKEPIQVAQSKTQLTIF